MSHGDKAIEYFGKNFNCAQGIFTTYAVENGFDEKMALKLGTNFGGGARKGEMCGAVSGALMVLGLLHGHYDGDDADSKARAYTMAEDYMNRFIMKNGSVVCREILGYDLSRPGEMARIKEQNLFHTRCPEMIRSAADILDELLEEYGKQG